MIKVLGGLKFKNRVDYYLCEVDGEEKPIKKSTLVDLINSGEVENARVQVYKGRNIIRIKPNSNSVKQKKKREQSEEKIESNGLKAKEKEKENMSDIFQISDNYVNASN